MTTHLCSGLWQRKEYDKMKTEQESKERKSGILSASKQALAGLQSPKFVKVPVERLTANSFTAPAVPHKASALSTRFSGRKYGF